MRQKLHLEGRRPHCFGARPLLVDLEGGSYLTGMARSRLQHFIAIGVLRARKDGSKVLIETDSLELLRDVLPTYVPGPERQRHAAKRRMD